jgi:hypothetical protein
MFCAIEMGSGAMIHEPRFIKIGSGMQNLIGGKHTDRENGDFISLLLSFFFKYGR